MKQSKQVIDDKFINSQTDKAKSRISEVLKKAEMIKADSDKENRLKLCLCPKCHYLANHRIGGAAITTRPCGICEYLMSFSSTATDVICEDCATQSSLCKQCGGMVNIDLD